MPSTDESTTDQTAATHSPTTGEGNGSGADSGPVAGGGPAAATLNYDAPHDPTEGSRPTIWSGHNVYQRIAWVITQLPGIPKDQEYEQGSTKYNYRGIESIQRTAAHLLAGAGVVYAPRARVTERDTNPPNMKPGWQDTHAEYEWIIHGTMGDQYLPPPVTLGVGRDNADKGANKGASQGLKYMLIALLQIADGKDDPDQHGDYPGGQMTAEEREAAEAAKANPRLDDDTRQALVDRAKALPQAAKDQLAQAWTRQDPDGAPYLPTSDGKPWFAGLRHNDLLPAQALLLSAEKAAEGMPPDPEPPSEQAQSVTDRAAAMAAQHQTPPSAPSDAPSGPEAGAGTDSAPEPAEGDTAPPMGPTVPLPDGTVLVTPDGEPLPDLAAWDMGQLAGARKATEGQLADSGYVKAVDTAVAAIRHPQHVNREVLAVPGQTVGDDEDIDHRRVRVALCRLVAERQRRAGVQ